MLFNILQIWKRSPETLALLFRRGTNWKVRLLIIVALIYLFLPADLIPEWIVGPGFIDDIVVVTVLFEFAHRLEEKYSDS